jgi:hypothetical protein
MSKTFKIGPEELMEVDGIQKNLKSQQTMGKINAIVGSARLSVILINSSEFKMPINSAIFEDTAVRLSEQIYDQEKQKAGVSGGLKKKIAAKKGI